MRRALQSWRIRDGSTPRTRAASVESIIFPIVLNSPATEDICQGRRGAVLKFDVPVEFGACVESVGGELLDRRVFPDGVGKADYWFPRFNVVAELKCLSEDLREDPAFCDRIVALHKAWVARGLVAPRRDGRIYINLKTMPEPCAFEVLDYMKRRFESNVVAKASRQIRATQAHLGVGVESRGLLIIANDADTLCSPEMICHIIARTTRRHNSSVNSVLLFSANLPATVRGTHERRFYWVDGVIGNRPPVSKELRVGLNRAWMKRHSAIFGSMPVYESNAGDGNISLERLHYPIN
jgi:hypothetical protein